jgi:hypothetical protein
MMRLTSGLICVAVLSAVFLPSALSAQTSPQFKPENDLFFTYAGAFVSGGYSKVSYTGFTGDTETTKKSTGSFFAGGAMLDVFVRDIIGDFRIAYMFDKTSDSRAKINHTFYSAGGKYLFHATSVIGLTAGGGLYFEGAPASRSYNGAGGEVSCGALFDLADWNMKIHTDLSARYGFFGQAAKSNKMQMGGSLGVTRKVGRS